MDADLAVVAAVVIAFALVSRRIGPTVISAPMLFVAAGLICGPEVLDAVDFGLEARGVEVIGEFSLAVLLFADATRIDVRALRGNAGLPARLLTIGLPLTVGALTLLVHLLIPDVSWAEAALIGAILAPTDAALGQEVVTDASVPVRVRQGLNVESGLNDGMVVPAVALFLTLSLAEGDTASAGFWARFVLEQVGIGVAVGLAVGVAGAWLLNTFSQRGWTDGVFVQLATLAIGVFAFTTSLSLDGNGFIAAFVAGIAFGATSSDPEHAVEYTEDTAQLAAAVSFFLFGNVLLGPALADSSVGVVLCALAALTVARMLPVAIATLGTGAAWPTVVFLGWFGPRGLASILFGLLLFEEDLARADELFGVVAWTVLLSVVLHGATAAAGASAYGRWYASMTEDEKQTMAEGVVVEEQRIRNLFRR